jgi:hypothetical protein
VETYLARADRIISHAEINVATQRNAIDNLKSAGAATDEAERVLGLMLAWLAGIRANRRNVESQINARNASAAPNWRVNRASLPEPFSEG